MATKPSIDSLAIGRFLTIELARATELAAVAAAQFRGRGDEMAAGEAALVAMRSHLTLLPAHGRVVIGEGGLSLSFLFWRNYRISGRAKCRSRRGSVRRRHIMRQGYGGVDINCSGCNAERFIECA